MGCYSWWLSCLIITAVDVIMRGTTITTQILQVEKPLYRADKKHLTPLRFTTEKEIARKGCDRDARGWGMGRGTVLVQYNRGRRQVLEGLRGK